MKAMKVGILAAGAIADKMAATLNALDETECYAIGSRSLQKAKDFAEKHHIKKAYGSYEELVKDPEIELIYIASPHSHHLEHARLCLNSGKHVLIEKSFTVNAKEAEEIFALADEKNLLAADAIWTRYLPSRTIIQKILERGEIGDIISATANLGYEISEKPRIKLPELAGGALLDVGIYPLNFVSMFLGNDIDEVATTCELTPEGVDGKNMTMITYRSGQTAMIHSQIYAATEQSGIIYGTKGYLIAHNINNIDKVSVYDNKRKLVHEQKMPKQIGGFEYEVLSVVNAIREGRRECPEMPREETLTIMRLMDEIRSEWGMRYPFED